MTRTLAIGVIHGGLRALKQILERAKITQNDVLIFLGDYVDGWSESAQTVSFLIELSKTHNCIFMRGNHDDLTYQWLRDNTRNDTWLNHGGRSTLKSYEDLSQETKEEHLEFYKNLKELKKRLDKRGRDNKKEIKMRLSLALSEISHHNDYQYVIINDKLNDSIKTIAMIIKFHQLKTYLENKVIKNLKQIK